MPGQRRRRDHSAAISVVLGSSQATIALIERGGRVSQRLHAKMLWNRPAGATLEPCLRAIDGTLAHARAERLHISGLGFALPGALDLTSRRPTVIPTLPALNGLPLAALLESRYHLPVALHVDVDAAALGEYHFGAGRGLRRLLLLSANAVVGASLLSEGRVENAPADYVGHVCHLSVSNSGPRCSCGKRGCLNTLVTLDAVQKMLQRIVKRGDTTSIVQRLNNQERFSLQLLAEEAEAGDVVASQIYTEVCRWLGAATARYLDLFEPNLLILGGIFSSGDLLLSGIRRSLASASTSRVCSMVEVATATLGRDAVLLGAAADFLQR